MTTLGELKVGDKFTKPGSSFLPDEWRTVLSTDGNFVYYSMPGYSTLSDFGSLEVERVGTPVGVKHDSNKPRPSLFSAAFLLEIGAVLEHGASKYSEGNWKLVDKTRYLDAAFRHWLQYLTGEKLDKDTGLSHLAHLAANLSFLWSKDNEANSP